MKLLSGRRSRRVRARRSLVLVSGAVAGCLALGSGTYADLTFDQIGGDLAGGPAVALSDSGERVATGSPGPDDGSFVGIVRVFERNGAGWSQLGTDLTGEQPGDQFGSDVELSADGNRVAAGAWRNKGTSEFPEGGHVRVFEWNGTDWVQLGSDIDGDAGTQYLGSHVALSADGSRVASAGWGRVHVFDWDGTDWVQAGTYLPGAERGMDMSADGTRLAAVAQGGGFGDVIVYDWTGSEWAQVGGALRPPTAEWGGWGGPVKMSADGLLVSVGGEDRAFNPLTVTFRWNGQDWVVVGTEITRYVSAVSGDGTRLASRDPVGVYEWDGNDWSTPSDVPQTVGGAAFSADGTVLAAGIGGRVSRVFDVAQLPPAPPTTTLPPQTTITPTGILPETGPAGTASLLVAAGSLLLAGVGLTAARRRPGHRHT